VSKRTYAVRAIVLRSRPIGEKDRVLSVLTAERGKLSVAARGARNPKSKLAALAQPFTLARLLVAKGRSLDILSQGEVENAHTHLAGDLTRTAWATYFCELADAVPEELPEAELFHLLETTLDHLDHSTTNDQAETVGRWFEAQYLMLLGYAPTIGRCVECGSKINVPAQETERTIFFSPARGGTLCNACAFTDAARINAKVQSLRALHQLGKATAPPVATEFSQQLQLTTVALRDLREILRRSLASHLDMKVKSRAFLDEVLSAPSDFRN
jgi:DNA repair protein RecO (recombination protein O)